MNYQDENARAIDRWVEQGWEWGVPITHAQYAAALRGEWDVLLTPTKPVPHAWFGELKGKKVLGLASGGGQQIPIFPALGGGWTGRGHSGKQLGGGRPGGLGGVRHGLRPGGGSGLAPPPRARRPACSRSCSNS